MRNRMVWAVVILVVLSVPLGCSARRTDVVNGIPPVSTSLASIADTVNDMARMNPAERGAYLEKNWPHLDEDVVFYLRRHGKLRQDQQVRRVQFRYGSAENVEAESGDGSNRRGYFANQLVALVYSEGARDPIAVIVQCLNGTFMLPGQIDSLQAVGEHTPIERFTIGPREGLIHHVDFPVAIDLAEQHRLPLYRGRTMTRDNRLEPAEARLLESTTDRLQVTVYVVEGDRFDLAAGTFTPSPRRTSR